MHSCLSFVSNIVASEWSSCSFSSLELQLSFSVSIGHSGGMDGTWLNLSIPHLRKSDHSSQEWLESHGFHLGMSSCSWFISCFSALGIDSDGTPCGTSYVAYKFLLLQYCAVFACTIYLHMYARNLVPRLQIFLTLSCKWKRLASLRMRLVTRIHHYF